MNVLGYAAFVGVVLVIVVVARWYDPALAAQLSRKTGLDGAKGWSAVVLATAWMFLPVLAGANAGEDDLWVVGAAVAGVGFYVGTIAVTSIDEYRLLRAVEHVSPTGLRPGSGPVATSGVPAPGDGTAARTPFTGTPSVHTDWMVQRRTQLGTRETWQNVAGGVTNVEFTLGDDTVAVTSGGTRVFSNAETYTTVEPDEPLPDGVAAFLRDRPDLPNPEDREKPYRFIETRVPADEPVTVVGTPRLGDSPGQYVVDEAPPDELLGTHGAADGGDPEVILVCGDADEAQSRLHKRVYWLGTVAVAMILGGQALSFALSAASVTAFF